MIQSDQDFAIQIPLELLKQCPHIVGVCSANTSEKALRGALRSGIFTHIAARAELVKSLLGPISNICNSLRRIVPPQGVLFLSVLHKFQYIIT